MAMVGQKMSALEAIKRQIVMATGMDPDSVGQASYERAIRLRMTFLNLNSLEAYAARVSSSHDELQALVDEVTIPETWFFRDGEPFKCLVDSIAKGVIPLGDMEKLRVLSVPCSTGEEPYSIAMSLLASGLPVSRLQIDAMDISGRVLERARAGVYGPNSFRGVSQNMIRRYFDVSGERYEIHSDVRAAVTFRQGNILSSEFLASCQNYHVIFCRNLLIYFNVETKQRVLKKLHGLLKESGLLFLGHAETGRIDKDLFEAVRYPRAFAYQKSARKKTPVIDRQSFSVANNKESPIHPGFLGKVILSREDVRDAVVDMEGAPCSLSGISEMADRGELDNAERLCLQFLEKYRDSGEAYYILALIQLARGNELEGEKSLRKSLYLDPNHYESLTHMATLLEGQGKFEHAEKYRLRAQRVADRLE